jgi:hypothetical protein
MAENQQTWILISFDADSCFHNGCRPLTEVAEFVGFVNEEEIVNFILENQTCSKILEKIIECMAWFNDLYERHEEEFVSVMKRDFNLLQRDRQVRRILDLFEDTWKTGSSDSMMLVPKSEKLFTAFRLMNREVWWGGGKKFVKSV